MDQYDTTEPTPPLKRHAALQPLSREHMGGLIQARRLRNASEQPLDVRRRAVDEFAGVWRTEIREHFNDEERLLLPLTESPDLRERLLAEHYALRKLAMRCEQDPDAVASDPETLRILGSLLHDHIRWEERVFFEALQENAAALASLHAEAQRIEAERPGSRAR